MPTPSQQEITELRFENAKLKVENAILEGNITDLQDQNDALSGRLAEVENASAGRDQEVNDLRARVADLERALADIAKGGFANEESIRSRARAPLRHGEQ